MVARATPMVTAQLMRDCSCGREVSKLAPKSPPHSCSTAAASEPTHLQLLRCRIAVHSAERYSEIDKGESFGHGEEYSDHIYPYRHPDGRLERGDHVT